MSEEAQASSAAAQTLERLVQGRLDQFERNEKIVERLAEWGIPTVAIVNDQTARLRFEAQAAHKLKENPTMTSATATAHAPSGNSFWQGIRRALTPLRWALALLVLLAVVIGIYMIFFNHPKAIEEEPLIPPAITAPSAPDVPDSTTVAGQPGTGRNRVIEIGEMCPSMNVALMSMLVTGSFESYTFQLPLTCGGYKTALVDPGTTDILSAPSDPLDTGNCPNDSTPTLDAETDMWICVTSE